MRIVAAILAGGKGERAGGEVPKQFLPVGGKPLLLHSAEIFDGCPEVSSLLVVVPDGWVKEAEELLKPFRKLTAVIPGGETRQASSFCALRHLSPSPPDYLIIHDAARPLITSQMVRRIAACAPHPATFALRATDTVAEGAKGKVMKVLDRERVYLIQTPQGAPFSLLYKAHLAAQREGIRDASDDMGLLLRRGVQVTLLEGDRSNIKVTTPEDLLLAEALLRERG